jgi:hypothetical protein
MSPGPCAGFEERKGALARLNSEGQYYGGSCVKMEYGRCGGFRYVDWANGFERYTEYYDGAGQIASARFESDAVPDCEDGSHELWWGDPPTCEHVVEKDYCASRDSGP